MGGKYRQGKKIAEHVGKLIKPGMAYYEPFCGAMGSAFRCIPIVQAGGGSEVVLSDISECVINMWKALLDGWQPPDFVSEEEYFKLKAIQDPKDPMTAFVGFGMAFGGKFFGTPARSIRGYRGPIKSSTLLINKQLEVLVQGSKLKKVRNYIAESKKSSLERKDTIVKSKIPIEIKCCSYEEIVPENSLMYLDPPYADRTNPHNCAKFDHVKFWDYARTMVAYGNTVLITEFAAPDDFVRVYSWGDTVVRHYAGKGSDGTNESIFMHESQIDLLI